MLSKSILNANRLIINQRAAAFSSWAHLTPAPADPILGLNEAFKNEKNPKKVLLGMGAYRTDQGKPFILPCVKLAEEKMLADNMDHEYAGIQGIDSYILKCIELGYGKDSKQRLENRIAGTQSISGTGALRLGLTFFQQWYPHKDIDYLVPNPTWPIHKSLGDIVGLKTKEYRYYNTVTKGLDYEGLTADLKAAKNHSFVMLHVCAHNPTGVDPTDTQWQNILDIVKTKKLFCGFDSAY
jgi:aspartate aminotransferase